MKRAGSWDAFVLGVMPNAEHAARNAVIFLMAAYKFPEVNLTKGVGLR